MKHILDDYRRQRAAERQKPDLKMSAIPEEYKYTSDDNDDNVDTSKETERVALDVGRKEEKWDCESIISTYSNIYNHPKLIEEPSIKRKVSSGLADGSVFNSFKDGDRSHVTSEGGTKHYCDNLSNYAHYQNHLRLLR